MEFVKSWSLFRNLDESSQFDLVILERRAVEWKSRELGNFRNITKELMELRLQSKLLLHDTVAKEAT